MLHARALHYQKNRTNASLLINSNHLSQNRFLLPRQINVPSNQLTSRRPKVPPFMGIPIDWISEHAQIEQCMTSSTILPRISGPRSNV
jgi:hypothetical protein